MKREYYEEEMMVIEAITNQKNDKEIGMPDVEQELRRVKQMAKRKQSFTIGWQRIAAVIALVLSITGLTWAFIYYQKQESAITIAAEQPMTEDTNPVIEQEDTIEVKVSKVLTLSYDKASLEQIVVDLTAYYHLEKPVFEHKETARKCKMHVTINKEASIEEAVGLLNQFGNIRIDLVDNKLIVK